MRRQQRQRVQIQAQIFFELQMLKGRELNHESTFRLFYIKLLPFISRINLVEGYAQDVNNLCTGERKVHPTTGRTKM